MDFYRKTFLTIIEKELESYHDKDVLIYYQRGSLHVTHGFFIWNGFSHTNTTISELLLEGFEKSDIKELRLSAEKFLIIEKSSKEFEIKRGEKE